MNFALALLCAALAQTPEPADAGLAPEGPAAAPDAAVAAPGADAAATEPVDASAPLPSVAPPAPARAQGVGALLNPEISVVLDGVAGWSTARPVSPSRDDPDLNGDKSHPMGATLQELELGLSSTVDSYFSANVYLTIANLKGLEVEESYARTLSLPWDLELKAGIFRSSAGRQNEQHLHVQDFSRRPLVNAAYLGDGGLRGPGVQLSWLLAQPFCLRLAVEAFSLERGKSPTFGGALRTAPTFVATAKTLVAATESLSVLFGLTGAEGHAFVDGFPQDVNGPQTWLAGADLYLEWKPPHVGSFLTLALTAEYFWRYTNPIVVPGVSYFRAPDSSNDGGFYAQLTAQLARRWHVGFRYDFLGAPSSSLQQRAERAMIMADFTPTEGSRVRLQGSRTTQPAADDTWEVLLMLELAIGPHGAHPF